MRYASVPPVKSLDDLMGSGPSFVSSLPVADWEAIDRDLDGLWRDVKKKEEEEEVITDPDPIEEDTDPEKTPGRLFTEKLYGGEPMTDVELKARMKYNPATTPEDWARAFGKCRTTRSSDKHESIPSDCYFPEESGLSSSDFSKNRNRGRTGGRGVGKSGGSGTASSAGSDGGVKSDIQLKENITYIDKSPEGHSIYEWNYKGEPKSRRYQGVMAQELLETAPRAVVTMDDGYLGVKYDEIDVEFATV